MIASSLISLLSAVLRRCLVSNSATRVLTFRAWFLTSWARPAGSKGLNRFISSSWSSDFTNKSHHCLTGGSVIIPGKEVVRSTIADYGACGKGGHIMKVETIAIKWPVPA